MKLHEYHAKQLFDRAGIPVPFGVVARTAAEAGKCYETVRQRGGGQTGFPCNVKHPNVIRDRDWSP